MPGADVELASKVAGLSKALSSPRFEHLKLSLSLRQMTRAVQLGMSEGEEAAVQYLHECCLAEFFPSGTAKEFGKALKECGLSGRKAGGVVESFLGRGSSGTTGRQVADEVPLAPKASEEGNASDRDHLHFVPRVVFFDNDAQQRVMESMKKQLDLGHHLLLLGNQGVGKNKLCDRLLELHSMPRQYIQLHRYGRRALRAR